MNVNRRKLLRGTAGLATFGLFGSVSNAFATPEEVADAVKEIAGDAEVATSGALKLTTPEIAENGNSVPVSVTVDSPMTQDNYVESVTIFAEGNPIPQVATFNFTPASGLAKASTRMRLAKTQNVVAVAKMSNGDVFTDSRNVKVTIGGCGG